MDQLTEDANSASTTERPHCGITGCKKGVGFNVSILLYPAAPVVAAPTYRDRGARVTIGRVCKKHRGTWTVASFLNSSAWKSSGNAHRFSNDFGGDPDPTLARIDVVRA
jgi:hypothetical protein